MRVTQPSLTDRDGPAAVSAATPAVTAARDRWRIFAARVILAATAILAWEATARWLTDPFWIGQPSQIAQRLWQFVLSNDLTWHAVPTVTQAMLGLLLSLVVGIPIGLVFASSRFVEQVLEPFFLGLYTIPRIALAPLFILWFGIGPASKVMMAFSLVVFVVILNTYEGLRGVDRKLIDMLRAMQASHVYILRKVLLPSIVPWILPRSASESASR
jgi:NitT/TauT family transport system permease protein